MNRASRYILVLGVMLGTAMLGSFAQIASAQKAHSIPLLRSTGAPPPHIFYPQDMKKLPTWTRYTHFNLPATGRAPGDQGVPRQTILLSKQNPSDSFSITPAPCSNEHPFWTADESYIYFDSNRASANVTTPIPTGIYNIYRFYPDGTGVSQIVPDANNNQIEPAVSVDGTQLAFAGGGKFASGSGTANPVTNGFNLYLFSLTNGGSAQPVTDTSPGVTFSDVRHPSWSPGGDAVAFSGELQGQTTYHIFTYTLATAQITQLTSGSSNETGASWSPDGRFIAFSSNATSFSAGAAPSVSAGVAGNYDIWVISTNPNTLATSRVTNFAVSGQQSNNYHASWSTLNNDPLGIIPQQPDPTGVGAVHSQLMLAFASDREDTNNDGIANAINPNHSTDVYWLGVKELQTAPGVISLTDPESAGNVAHKLQTSEPDTAINPQDPTYNFDLNHTSNEDFPVWPQYHNSYRIVFQSDRGGSLEIWGATMLDIQAPTLLKYDIGSNEIVHIEKEAGTHTGISLRQVNAGDTVRFGVRAVDYESGVQGVYLQIKCPDAAQRSPDGEEHRVFVQGVGAINGSPTTPTIAQLPGGLSMVFEFDYQAVNASVAASSSFPQFRGKDSNDIPIGNTYTPGVEDVNAFSGYLSPPDNYWLQLYDDGTAPSGHEPPGETAGDGVYTADWTTPSSFPSDWVIDVVIYNNAVNPFNTSQTSNWRIYDNVWGFSTKPFQALHNTLYVDDYDTGQKFFNNTFGSGSFQRGQNFLGLAFNGTPTESYMTEFDPNLFPTSYLTPPTTVGPLEDFLNTLGAQSYGSNYSGDGLYYDGLDDDGSGVPPTQSYDIWRIQCRGPVPQSVLNSYAPYFKSIPPDASNPGAPTKVLVAEKCILWHSPYSGDLFVGPGTILDPATQTELTNFVSSGGRLFVCGQDIAWGLTLGGSQPNAFLTNVLHANYVSQDSQTDVITLVGANGTNPISWGTWYNANHSYPPYPPTQSPNDPPGKGGSIYIGPTSSIARYAACPNEWNDSTIPVIFGHPNVVSIAGGATSDGNYSNGHPAVIWYSDPIALSRVVFSPFGWEAINPEVISMPGTPSPLLVLNRRMEMMHNVLDYMRTGRIIGTIRAFNSGSGGGGAAGPLANVLVRAIDPNGNEVSTALTQSDGSYVLSGLNATGIYALDAIKAGYVTQHDPGGLFHGSYQGRTDFYMSVAQPGVITGVVTDFITGLPVGGVVVTATDTSGTATANTTFTGTSSPTNGVYSISSPASTYTVNVTGFAGYASSIPVSYTGVIVAPAQTVIGKNFQLKQIPGNISGKVDIADANGNDTGNPLPGATITATNNTNSSSVFVSAPPAPGGSAADGTYTITNVDAGSYSVSAAAPGYSASPPVSATVTSNQTVTGILLLCKTTPPGSISGLVATSTGIPVSGATITVTNASGTVLATTTTVAPQTAGAYTYNYKLTGVPAGGTVNVTAIKSGYTPKPIPDTQTVSVTSGTETQNINFTIDPLYTFNNNLTLVSSPYLYTTTGTSSGSPLDVVTLLSVPSSDVSSNAFAFIGWNPNTQGYISYPTPPANTFQIGSGYFLQDTSGTVMALTNPNGIPAPQDGSGNYLPFNIPLHAGWNLIGDPYTLPVNFDALQVQLQNGVLENVTNAQAGSTPVIGAALWTYQQGSYAVVYTLDPFVGCWLQVFQPCTLVVLPGAQQGRAVTQDSGRALEYASGRNGNWKLNIMASTNNLQSQIIIGTNSIATDQYDRYKLQTPPVTGTRSVMITVNHTDWGTRSGAYSVDVRSLSATTWSFNVQSNVPNTPVTLTWPNLASTGRHDMLLTDLDTNTTFDLHNRAAYTIPASSNQAVHHFQLVVQRATRQPLQLLDVSAAIIPGRGAAQAASASISYMITAQANVEVRILSNGRTIRTLQQGTSRSAGSTSAVWDLKDDQGMRVPGGVYQVEVRAVAADGHIAPAYVPLVITR